MYNGTTLFCNKLNDLFNCHTIEVVMTHNPLEWNALHVGMCEYFMKSNTAKYSGVLDV